MATIRDLPCILLYEILFLVVRSSLGAVDLARIISVCREFFAYADDERLLKVVSFDSRMDCKKYFKYQHVNGLLVKCSKVGNISAQFMLGKVIVLSSSQLFLRELQIKKFKFSQFNLARLGQNFGTDIDAQSFKDISFLSYFWPTQASTSESSETRLVHYQLVKVFLQSASHRDFIEMEAYLESYISCFSNNNRNCPLVTYIGFLVSAAAYLRKMEIMIGLKQKFVDALWAIEALDLRARHYLGGFEDTCNAREKLAWEYGDFLLRFQYLCDITNLDYAEAGDAYDERPLKSELDMAYYTFKNFREVTLALFDRNFKELYTL